KLHGSIPPVQFVSPLFAAPTGAPAPHRVEVVASWGMGALAPVVEFTSELQERPGRFNVRGVRRPGHTPVGILQGRGRRLTVAAQVAGEPPGGPAGGEKDLILHRLQGLTGPPPPGPHRDV